MLTLLYKNSPHYVRKKTLGVLGENSQSFFKGYGVWALKKVANNLELTYSFFFFA